MAKLTSVLTEAALAGTEVRMTSYPRPSILSRTIPMTGMRVTA